MILILLSNYSVWTIKYKKSGNKQSILILELAILDFLVGFAHAINLVFTE